MKFLRSVLVLFMFVFFGIGAFIINYFIIPFKKQNKNTSYKVVSGAWKFFVSMLQKTKIISIEIDNKEKLKDIKGKIVVANHPSFIDVVLLTSILPKSVCVAKKELKKNFFMGNIVKSLYLINDENKETLIKDAKNILDEGFNIIIFPTGTRTLENEPLILHKGASMIAISLKVNIVPIFIKTDYKFLAKKQKVYDAGDKPVKYFIKINDEIEIKEENLSPVHYRNKINNIIRDRISKAI